MGGEEVSCIHWGLSFRGGHRPHSSQMADEAFGAIPTSSKVAYRASATWHWDQIPQSDRETTGSRSFSPTSGGSTSSYMTWCSYITKTVFSICNTKCWTCARKPMRTGILACWKRRHCPSTSPLMLHKRPWAIKRLLEKTVQLCKYLETFCPTKKSCVKELLVGNLQPTAGNLRMKKNRCIEFGMNPVAATRNINCLKIHLSPTKSFTPQFSALSVSYGPGQRRFSLSVACYSNSWNWSTCGW